MIPTEELLKIGSLEETRERLKMYVDICARLERCVHEMIKEIENDE